jgi:hypothetical protein
MPMIRRALFLTAATLMLAGCGILPGLETPLEGPIVTVDSRGGRCVDGECLATVVIERDGRVHDTVPESADRGRLRDDLRAALEEAVASTDFERLRSRPFTGECPVNYDGQEQIYTFTTVSGPVRLASCEVEIDPSDPLFVAVENAFGSLAAP